MTNNVTLDCKDVDNLQDNSLTEISCVTTPVEVEVTKLHEFLYEQDNIKTTSPNKQKKPGIWKTIFGEKKCKSCSKTKHECTCKDKKKKIRSVEKDHSRKAKCEDTAPVFNCSAYGTSTEVQKTGNCPTKCSLPMTQGCGCHLYFCIDSKRKKQQLKSKKHKNKQNEEIKVDGRLPVCTVMECDYSCTECVPQVTLFCDKNDDSDKPYGSQKLRKNPLPKTKGDEKLTVVSTSRSVKSNGTNMFKFSADDKTVFHIQSNKTLLNRDSNKPKTDKITTCPDNGTNLELLSAGNKFDKIVYQSSIAKGNNNPKTSSFIKNLHKDEFLEKSKAGKDQTLSDKGSGILSNNGDESEKVEKTVSIMSVKRTKSQHSQKNIIPDSPPNMPSKTDSNEETVENEYSNIDLYRKKTRKSTARSLFARNSLITLRRERRQSEFEEGVALIMEKLGNIENKITELEKVSTEEKEKKITMGMGITCDGQKSKISVKFDKEPGKKALDKKSTLVHISPSEGNSHKTIRIRSNNEEIYVNAPKEVNIVRSKQRETLNNRSKQVVYENSYEMDVHTIGSNSATVQCNNPKLVVSCKKPQVLCKSLHCPWKWRRISDELKKSNLNVDDCETCSHKVII